MRVHWDIARSRDLQPIWEYLQPRIYSRDLQPNNMGISSETFEPARVWCLKKPLEDLKDQAIRSGVTIRKIFPLRVATIIKGDPPSTGIGGQWSAVKLWLVILVAPYPQTVEHVFYCKGSQT